MLIPEVVTRLDKFVKIHRTSILQKGEFYCMSVTSHTENQIPQQTWKKKRQCVLWGGKDQGSQLGCWLSQHAALCTPRSIYKVLSLPTW